MKKVLIPLADGFEEIETTTLIDVLRRAGIEVVVAGVRKGSLIGAHKIQLNPDRQLDEIKNDEFDMVVLPGGQPGVDNLRGDARVLDLLKKRNDQKKLIGAICAAPLALRDAGLIQGLHMTSYPGMKEMFEGSKYSEERTVQDGHVLTSRGPGTAMEFSLKIVEILLGISKVEELKAALLAPVTAKS